MKKRLALAAVVLVLTLCVAALCARPSSRITFGTYQQIQVGMTRQQVEAILGPATFGTPCPEVKPKDAEVREVLRLVNAEKYLPPEEWWGHAGLIEVWFDRQGNVTRKRFGDHPCELEEVSFWDDLRARLPWQRPTAPN